MHNFHKLQATEITIFNYAHIITITVYHLSLSFHSLLNKLLLGTFQIPAINKNIK